MGNSKDWLPIIYSLPEKTNYLAFDLPGHGKTDISFTSKEDSFLDIANNINSFLEFHKINKCCLVGYSMGGRIALCLSLLFPDRFSKVILESTNPGLQNKSKKNSRYKNDLKIAEQLITDNYREFLDKWYEQAIFYKLKAHPDYDKMIDIRLQNNPILLAEALKKLSIGVQQNYRDNLIKNTKIHILFLAGENDIKYKNITYKLKSDFITIKIIENSGHNIHLENKEIFLKHIKQFLNL